MSSKPMFGFQSHFYPPAFVNKVNYWFFDNKKGHRLKYETEEVAMFD